MTRRACALVVRAVVVIDGYKVPSVPGSWDVTPEADGWSTLYPLGRATNPDVYVHAFLGAETTSGAWFITGPRAVVDQIVALATRSWATLGELRADNGAVATAVKTAWIARWGGAVIPYRMAGYDEDDGAVSG